MKKYFYLGALGLLLFEIANVFFIMPMPGSQEMNSIDLAYFLNKWRWVFRIFFGFLIILGFIKAWKGSKIFTSIFLIAVVAISYMANFQMAADAMFLQTKSLQMRNAQQSKIDSNRVIIGIENNGEAKAYPIQFLGYHHQVLDSLAGQPIIVTYCTVCRTGRVFQPIVNGHVEHFRLVGMDHFNAMFEDESTKSWWRQATGEAIAGQLRGQKLPTLSSTQMRLGQWLKLYPNSLIMQTDSSFKQEYADMTNYEAGKNKGKLTRRDSLSWQPKSWIVGVALGNEAKAYDWNLLQKNRIIYDVLNNQPIVVLLARDSQSFVVLKRTNVNQQFKIENDQLHDLQNSYNLLGHSLNPLLPNLQKIDAYQEYWHSWQTFHPNTKR